MQGLPLDWRGASFCQGGECVWIGAENGAVIMRSSQPDSAWIYFTPDEFSSFLNEAKAGEYDRPR
jgi:Domain of unknown function (DUF397)